MNVQQKRKKKNHNCCFHEKKKTRIECCLVSAEMTIDEMQQQNRSFVCQLEVQTKDSFEIGLYYYVFIPYFFMTLNAKIFD